MDLLVHQLVVDLNSDVLNASQPVRRLLESTFKTTCFIWFRTTNFPKRTQMKKVLTVADIILNSAA